MKNYTFFLLITLFAFSCSNPTAQKESNQENTEMTAEEVSDDDHKSEILIYQSATVYAGATDYYFKDQSGTSVEIRVNNLPEEQTFNVPAGLLESNVEEGPPGANPEMIGKSFEIIYDNTGKVIAIRKVD